MVHEKKNLPVLIPLRQYSESIVIFHDKAGYVTTAVLPEKNESCHSQLLNAPFFSVYL